MNPLQKENNKLLKVKKNIDKFTSENFTNWKLVLFWIIIIELLASMFEYLFIGSNSISSQIPHTFSTELVVAVMFTGFVWACVHNFVFWNKTNFFYLILIGTLGLYIIVTNDVYFDFLVHNLEPTHFFSQTVSIVLFIELLFKLIITYLLYQLLMSLKNRKNI